MLRKISAVVLVAVPFAASQGCAAPQGNAASTFAADLLRAALAAFLF